MKNDMSGEGGKISFAEGGGGGINIILGPKYRPLNSQPTTDALKMTFPEKLNLNSHQPLIKVTR